MSHGDTYYECMNVCTYVYIYIHVHIDMRVWLFVFQALDIETYDWDSSVRPAIL